MARKKKAKESIRGNKKNSKSTITSIKIPITAKRIDPIALGYALACMRVIVVLVFSILAMNGYALNFIEILEKLHLYYSLDLNGIISGIAETAIWGLLTGIVVGWLYNKFV